VSLLVEFTLINVSAHYPSTRDEAGLMRNSLRQSNPGIINALRKAMVYFLIFTAYIYFVCWTTRSAVDHFTQECTRISQQRFLTLQTNIYRLLYRRNTFFRDRSTSFLQNNRFITTQVITNVRGSPCSWKHTFRQFSFTVWSVVDVLFPFKATCDMQGMHAIRNKTINGRPALSQQIKKNNFV